MPVQRSIKNSVEVTTDDSGNGRVNLVNAKVQKVTPVRVSIGGINTGNPKSKAMIFK